MYLPSFYKLQFEKYLFNTKRAGLFFIPVALWSNSFIIFFSRMVFLSPILQHRLHRLLPTSQRSLKKNPRIMILILHTQIFLSIHLLTIVSFLTLTFYHHSKLFIPIINSQKDFINLSLNKNLYF